jgi:hypothetical protein
LFSFLNFRILIEKPVKGRTIFQEAPISGLAEKQKESANMEGSKLNPSFLEDSVVPLLPDSSMSQLPPLAVVVVDHASAILVYPIPISGTAPSRRGAAGNQALSKL